MTKKDFIKLLLKTYGLKPFGVEKYIRNGEICWRGKGLDKNGDVDVSFDETGGFKTVISEIVSQALSTDQNYSYEEAED